MGLRSGVRSALLCCSILASTAPAVAVAGQADVDPARPAAVSDSVSSTDIVVTANRRSERLQDVPASVSALTGDQLAQAGITSTRDLQFVTPSLNWVQQSYAPQPTIRGIGSRGVNPGDEQVVPMYIDGVLQPFLVGGLMELGSVERIEVLKGPQGTLLGRNAIGGAINIITRRPTVDPVAEIKIGYGSYDERSASLYLAGGQGPIAASLDLNYLKDDGFVREVNTGTRLANIDSFVARLKIVAELSDRDELTLTGGYASREDNTPLSLFPINGNTSARRLNPNIYIAKWGEASHNFIPVVETEQKSASLSYSHDFGGFTFNSITGYSINTIFYDGDVDATTLNVYRLTVNQFQNTLTHDSYLVSNGSGPFSWIVGAFYFNDDSGFNPRADLLTRTYVDSSTNAYAFYGQASYELIDGLTFTAGARYSHDKKCMSVERSDGAMVPHSCKSWSSTDPSFTLDYRISEEAKVYVKYAQAFKAGVFNTTVVSPFPVDPESARSYEIGFKSDPASWLRVNLAGFYTDYTDIQVQTKAPGSTSIVLENAASARIIGVEGEMVIRASPQWNIRLSGSWLDAKYEEYLDAQALTPIPGGGNSTILINASGLWLPKVAEAAVSASTDYRFDLADGEVLLSGNAFYQGGYNWTIEGRITQPSYVTLNGQIAYRFGRDRQYEVALWGKNLSDTKFFFATSISNLSDAGAANRPRTFGVNVSAKF